MSRLEFRPVSGEDEWEQVHCLNYATFVDEIPQHAPNPDRRLVDDRLADSTVYVGVDGRRVVAMVAISDRRPFSLDRKLGRAVVDAHIAGSTHPCEVRLLVIARDYRGGRVIRGLTRCLYDHCRSHQHDCAVISATLTQSRFYRHLGFTPFGPPIGTPEAPYQGMVVTWETASRTFHRVSGAAEVNLLPGPVAMAPAVRGALAEPPRSHRGAAFLRELDGVRAALRRMTGARRCALLLGSGTLANDVIGAQLAAEGAPGVILVNGEFGERLCDHARRQGVRFRRVDAPWGAPPPWDRLRAACAGDAAWLWAVHCETSTGVLNDLGRLQAAARSGGAALCLDAVSSLGAAPLDLRGVRFAAGTSGKALAAYPGIAIVFHDRPVAPNPAIPRYLDLGRYDTPGAVPFTHSSNLLAALAVAVRRREAEGQAARIETRARWSAWLRGHLEAMGCTVVADAADAAPCVLTFEPPAGMAAQALGERLEALGFSLSFRSGYLQARNWLQVCLLGEVQLPELAALVQTLRVEFAAPGGAAAPAALKEGGTMR